MSDIKILGIYYSNSRVCYPLKKASIDSVEKMLLNTKNAKIQYSVWDYIEWVPQERQQKSYFLHNGHMNIALQIYRALLTNPEFDYVVFLEHDVLYHENYFNDIKII